MIDLMESRHDVAGPGSVREQVEALVARLPAAEAFATIEHLFGVLPLLETFFERPPAIESGLGALGLFTPAPEPGWEAAAVAGTPSGPGALLRGLVRLPGPAASGSLVLVRMEGSEYRLAWIDHGAPGAGLRGSRSGGPVQAGSPCWLALEDVAAGAGLLSRPVTATPGGDLHLCLAGYAGIWALAAAMVARAGVRALRRAARLNGHQGTAFSASQTVALEIAEVEIETELTAAAAQRHLASGEEGGIAGLAVAAAAARILAKVAATTAGLRDLMGLEIDGPLAGGSAAGLTAFLGGPAVIESELARALGIRDLPFQEEGG